MGVIAWIVSGIIVGLIDENLVNDDKSHGAVINCMIRGHGHGRRRVRR